MSIATERPDELIEILSADFQQTIGRVIIQDQKAANTQGGGFLNGAWRTRVLNTTVVNTIGAGYSLAANQFTLPRGVYLIYATAPAFRVVNHKARIQNITDAATEIVGTSEIAFTGDASQTISICCGLVTIASSKVFELQHRGNTTEVTDGFGVASNFGVIEVYSVVKIDKIG